MSRVILFFMGAVMAGLARAGEWVPPGDGWSSWQVTAVEHAPALCCESVPCDLDTDRSGYGTRDDSKADTMRVYARFVRGKLVRLRTLAAACPVKTDTPVQNLEVGTEDSARWLSTLKRQDLVDEVLSSLALHEGDIAFGALQSFAKVDPDPETRKQALFWMAVLRGSRGAAVVEAALFAEPDADIREHATFAITQSRSTRIADDLIRVGKTDASASVRAQAWFWLAQTGAPGAEAALVEAAREDRDQDVRERAVFALTQLPDPRSSRALIAVAEDRALSREQRKRAVFWLSQSDSQAAHDYLEQVLIRASP
jgi:hypothetical protein